MLEYSATGSVWKGEVINDVRHPMDIEYKWTEAELAAIGLRKRTEDIVASDVVNERKRRLSLGFEYDFGDERGIHHIGTTEADMVGWRDVIDYANALIDSGDTTTLIDIVTDTGAAQVTAPEWQAVMLQAATVRQTLWAKSFALQALSTIPGDFADDSHWT